MIRRLLVRGLTSRSRFVRTFSSSWLGYLNGADPHFPHHQFSIHVSEHGPVAHAQFFVDRGGLVLAGVFTLGVDEWRDLAPTFQRAGVEIRHETLPSHTPKATAAG